jgi:hypothetical protein
MSLRTINQLSTTELDYFNFLTSVKADFCNKGNQAKAQKVQDDINKLMSN